MFAFQPIENVNSNDIICNGGINPYIQPVSQTIHQVPQGATVGAEFRHGLGEGQVIDPTHKGPILAYLCVPSFFVFEREHVADCWPRSLLVPRFRVPPRPT